MYLRLKLYGGGIKAVLLVVLLLLVYFFCDRCWEKKTAMKRFPTSTLGAVSVILLSILSVVDVLYVKGLYREDWQRTVGFHKCSIILSYYFAYIDFANNTNLDKLASIEVSIDSCPVHSSEDSLTIVYVIGESHIKHRSNLYGYNLPTNPLMSEYKQSGSLYLFENVITHSNSTRETVSELLSMHSVRESENYEDTPLLPAIFKKAGYNVGYFDNQTIVGDMNGFDFSSMYIFARKGIRDRCYDYTNTELQKYDLDFVRKNPPRLDRSRRNLIIYHLMGQHRAQEERFPADQSYFTIKDYSDIDIDEDKKRLMSYYDNACLHNDKTLDAIIQSIKDETSILFYTSDHGEECYDYRDYYGRMAQLTAHDLGTLKVVYQVPLFIYVSDKFKKKYPHKVEALQRSCDKTIYNSDVVHTVLDVAGIETPSWKQKYSLLHDSVKLSPRYVEGINYDEIRKDVDAVKLYYSHQ